MVLVKGTNCGFVTVAPSAVGLGAGSFIDNESNSFKDTSPSNAIKVTEIGFYVDNATEAANFEAAIYAHDVGNNRPGEVVGSISRTNAKGTTSGWKRVTGLNITISPSTIYWIAIQLDDTVTTTTTRVESNASEKQDWITSSSTLPTPWGVSGGTAGQLIPFYAVWEAAPAAPVATRMASGWANDYKQKKKEEEKKEEIIAPLSIKILAKE